MLFSGADETRPALKHFREWVLSHVCRSARPSTAGIALEALPRTVLSDLDDQRVPASLRGAEPNIYPPVRAKKIEALPCNEASQLNQQRHAAFRGQAAQRLGGPRVRSQGRVPAATIAVHRRRDLFAHRTVDSLSGGERQRVWLAMFVAQDSECLLLDEPISALDIAHQIEVLQLVRTLSVERGLGVVVVLHDVNMAGRFCDDLLALKGGRLLASGTPAELMRPETLGAIYGIPMGTVPHPHGGSPISFAH